jgi:hypothetical protein
MLVLIRLSEQDYTSDRANDEKSCCRYPLFDGLHGSLITFQMNKITVAPHQSSARDLS